MKKMKIDEMNLDWAKKNEQIPTKFRMSFALRTAMLIDLGKTAYNVFLFLKYYCDGHDACEIGVTELAKDLSVTARTLEKALRKLRKFHFILTKKIGTQLVFVINPKVIAKQLKNSHYLDAHGADTHVVFTGANIEAIRRELAKRANE